MIAIDTETNGVDFQHGARPFLVTLCRENGEQLCWEWDVDPLTRKPIFPPEDIEAIREEIESADLLIFQNCKFDAKALSTIGIEVQWEKVRDTLLASHLLASNQPHDLTSLAVQYLGRDIRHLELAMQEACKKARHLAKTKFPTWRIAREGLSDMPSAKGGDKKGAKGIESDSPWKLDTWLPRAIAGGLDYESDHPWYTVTSLYANEDSAVTLALWLVMEKELRRRGLWEIYEERLKVLPVIYGMEQRGITIHHGRLQEKQSEFRESSAQAKRVCENIASRYNYELTLPKGACNGSLLGFVFGPLGLEPIKMGKKSPSLDKGVLEHYEATLPERSRQGTFVRTLRGKRKCDTAISFMESYEKFGIPISRLENLNGNARALELYYKLFPSLNPTGTDTLRFSCYNPNGQQISKQSGYNLRYIFGPAPGREWWSLDAKNIELRLPAYEAEEEEMIALFERPNDPPYFGSYHLLIFDILHPEKFAKHGYKSKDVYESTWYQWTKNGDFAVQYGAVEKSGTADRAYHVPGAQARIQNRFRKIKKLNDRMVAMADRLGYVETIPDKTVNPNRGYPLLCSRSEWGRVLTTVPLNYHVSGTAMWWMSKGMVRTQSYLDRLNSEDSRGYWMVLQVHDELVFDFPRGSGPEPWKTNLPKIRKIQRLMEEGGNDIGIPTPVSVEYHEHSWSVGKTL